MSDLCRASGQVSYGKDSYPTRPEFNSQSSHQDLGEIGDTRCRKFLGYHGRLPETVDAGAGTVDSWLHGNVQKAL